MSSGARASTWEPLPLWAAASGQYTTGALSAVPALVLLWLAHFVHPAGYPGLGDLVWPLALAVLVTKTIDLAAFRAASLRQQKVNPGSPAVTAVALVSPLVGGVVGALFVADRFWSVALVVAMLVVFLPTVLFLDQPWKEGPSRQETHRKIEETKTMTRRTFRPKRPGPRGGPIPHYPYDLTRPDPDLTHPRPEPHDDPAERER